jgi:putative hemolysin
MLESQVPSKPEPVRLGGEFLEGHGIVAKFLPLRRLNDLYRKVWQPEGEHFEANLLAEMQIQYHVDAADVARIPKSGPVVAVANHPFGILDGLLLAAILPGVRRDVKLITNYMVSELPELEEFCLFVDPFGGSAARNRKPLKEALNWLANGGMLAIFPAGEVSHWSPRRVHIEDPAWNDTAARLIRLTDATALPMYFSGRNSVSFHALGLIHPALRTARLAHEFLKARGKTVNIKIGTPIPASTLTDLSSGEATRYLRCRTYLLRNRGAGLKVHKVTQLLVPKKAQKPIAPALPQDALIADVAGLGADRCLTEDRECAVYCASAHEIPSLIQEIGRLREVTFRAVGEGSGKELDLDLFDDYYRHLFVWNKARQELVGAYRVGDVREILNTRGLSGLYTNTLFEYDPRLFEAVGDAFELGRSFVRPEYQKQYAPLLLLWKAISRLVCDHPSHAVLFGAVSISGEYSRISREFLVGFYGSRLRSALADYVHPRRSFRTRRLRRWEIRQLDDLLNSADALADTIADVENDRKAIPVLLRQYVKVGGQLLGFNVDRDFSNVVDGLILVDLRKTNSAILERYMGKAATASFLAHHGVAADLEA